MRRETSVAPSRGRGSKPCLQLPKSDPARRSPLRGGVDRNNVPVPKTELGGMSPLRGGVDRNRHHSPPIHDCIPSPLRGGVDRNRPPQRGWRRHRRRPFAGAWIETSQLRSDQHPTGQSPLRGGVDRNFIADRPNAFPKSSPLRGGVDRNAVWSTSPQQQRDVAPSRGRGSKRPRSGRPLPGRRRPFAGAWIETVLLSSDWRP